MNEKVQDYLARIGVSEADAAEPSPTLLNTLQQRHFESVPYENLDILLHRPLSMDDAEIYGKVVARQRGGYCFELNGIFGWLLRKLDFSVTDYMARFLLNEPEIPMRRHRILLVQIPGAEDTEYLCDVGVGIEVPRLPILLEENTVQTQGTRQYKMTKEDFFGWVLWENYQEEWRRVYSFTLEQQLPLDFVMPSFYCEKHLDSPFNKTPMISLKTLDGRKSLDGRIFKTFHVDTVTQYIPESSEDFRSALQTYFGLALTAQEAAEIFAEIPAEK